MATAHGPCRACVRVMSLSSHVCPGAFADAAGTEGCCLRVSAVGPWILKGPHSSPHENSDFAGSVPAIVHHWLRVLVCTCRLCNQPGSQGELTLPAKGPGFHPVLVQPPAQVTVCLRSLRKPILGSCSPTAGAAGARLSTVSQGPRARATQGCSVQQQPEDGLPLGATVPVTQGELWPEPGPQLMWFSEVRLEAKGADHS